MNLRISIVIGLFLLSVNLVAQEAEQIIEKSHEAVKLNSYEAYSVLNIKDSNGNTRIRKSMMATRSFPEGIEKRVIKFTDPPEVKGTGILIFDHETSTDDMWIYLPAIKKTRRIVSKEKSRSFMGSEFSNSDMTMPAMTDFSYKLIKSEEVDAVPCFVIESRPSGTEKEEEYGYLRSVSWIGKNDYVVRKTEYYDFEDQLFKLIQTRSFQEYKEGGVSKFVITSMYAENIENGRSSLLELNDVRITESDESYFTVSFLER